MGDQESRRKLVDRANRMLKQSRTLRKLSEELLTESKDVRRSADEFSRNHSRKRQPRKRARKS